MEAAREAIPITDTALDLLVDKAESQIKRIKGNLDLETLIDNASPEETYRTLPLELQLVFITRQGTCLYTWFAEWLFEHTGQKEEAKTASATPSIMAKQKFSSAYALMIMAEYIIQECDKLLKGKDPTQLASIKTNFKLETGRSFTQDLQIVFSYYADTITYEDENTTKLIKNASDTVAVTKDFWSIVKDKATELAKSANLDIQKVILDSTFRHNEFVIHGFEIEANKVINLQTWTPVEPNEIVGNNDVIIVLRRLADRLALYDPVKHLNPFCEIGGIYESVLIDGPPGTGKSTLFKMLMTLLARRADQVGISYKFKSLEAKDIKTEWYGKSGKLLASLIDEIIDPMVLGLLIVDDIDLLISTRDDPGSGGFDKDILKGLMDFFAGVGTKFIGNYTSVAATNKPTATEDALRQRFVYRAIVKGAESWEDCADLIALQLRKPMKLNKVDIKPYQYIPLKRVKPNRLSTSLDLPSKDNKTIGWADIGRYIKGLQDQAPWFTARSIKNAMDVVISSAGDFDIPEEWFTNPSVFRTKPWDVRVNMIKELYSTITVDMIENSIQNQYDNEKRYQSEAFNSKKEKFKEDIRVREAAVKEVN